MGEQFVYDWWTAGAVAGAVALLAIVLMAAHVKWPPRRRVRVTRAERERNLQILRELDRAVGEEWVRQRRRQ